MINTPQTENCVRNGELEKSCYSDSGVTVAHKARGLWFKSQLWQSFLFLSVFQAYPHPKWKENSDWSAGGKFKVSGVGGRPFCPAHNKPMSRSTRGTHFQVHGEQTVRA